MTLTPKFPRGRIDADTSVSLLGKQYNMPFGIAPIGLSSLIWPGSERFLASIAAHRRLPYTLSTAAGAIKQGVRCIEHERSQCGPSCISIGG